MLFTYRTKYKPSHHLFYILDVGPFIMSTFGGQMFHMELRCDEKLMELSVGIKNSNPENFLVQLSQLLNAPHSNLFRR